MLKFWNAWSLWILGGVIATLVAFGGVQTYRIRGYQLDAAKAKTDYANAMLEITASVHAKDAELTQLSNQISSAFERGVEHAKQVQSSLNAGFRSGTIRLQPVWQCPPGASVRQDAGAARELAEARRLREESASRIIGIAAECDARVNAYIELYNSLRKEFNIQVKPKPLR